MRTHSAFRRYPPGVPTYIPPACRGKPLTAVPRAVALAQPSRELETNPPIAKADQLTLFGQVAKTIDDVYVYRDFNGLPWPGIVADVRASVERGLDTEAFYLEMEQFVRKLGDRHSYFLSPVKAAAAKVRLAGENNYVGIGTLVRALPERKRGTVMAVFPDSPAEHAGVQQHDNLLAVDGLPMVVDGAIQPRTRGPECSVAILTVQSPGQGPRDIALVRYRVQAGMPIHARRVATSDGSRIGYIFLPSFFDVTLVDQVKTALNGFGPLDGLIIDNRMNSGGSSRVLLPILGYFTSGTVGHLVSRLARRPLEITADPVGGLTEHSDGRSGQQGHGELRRDLCRRPAGSGARTSRRAAHGRSCRDLARLQLSRRLAGMDCAGAVRADQLPGRLEGGRDARPRGLCRMGHLHV